MLSVAVVARSGKLLKTQGMIFMFLFIIGELNWFELLCIVFRGCLRKLRGCFCTPKSPHYPPMVVAEPIVLSDKGIRFQQDLVGAVASDWERNWDCFHIIRGSDNKIMAGTSVVWGIVGHKGMLGPGGNTEVRFQPCLYLWACFQLEKKF